MTHPRNLTVGTGLVLVAMVLALGMLTIDVTIVRVALPTIQRELGASDVAQQWIVNAYLLALGVLVIVGGRAGDLFGRRRVFLTGLGLFTACSVLSGVAPSVGALIAARAGQGAGAAVMLPGTTAILTDAFAGPRLGRAMGALAGTAAVGLSLGALAGGLLIEAASWRWIFFVNVPLGAVAAAMTALAVPESRDERAPPLDLRGFVALAAGLSALTLGLMQAQEWGWGSAGVLGLLAGSIVALGGFAAVEERVPAPLVDLAVLRERAVAAANGVAFCAQFVVTGLTVLLAIYLQDQLGQSALQAGALLLPLTLPVLVAAPLAGRLVERVGAKVLVTGGMAVAAIGVFAIGLGARADDYPPLLPGLVLFGFGFATMLTSVTTAVMAGAGALDRGMVAGVYKTARQVGGALGVAVMGSLLYTLENGSSFDSAFATTMMLAASVAGAGTAIAWFFLSGAPASRDHARHPPPA